MVVVFICFMDYCYGELFCAQKNYKGRTIIDATRHNTIIFIMMMDPEMVPNC